MKAVCVFGEIGSLETNNVASVFEEVK